MVVGLAATSNAIVNINFHSMSSSVDIKIKHCTITLESLGFFSGGYPHRSPVFNTMLRWKRKSWLSESNMTCTDDRGIVLARFEISQWSMLGDGKIELMGQAAQGPLAVEELVVTGIAMVEWVKKRSKISSIWS